MCICESEMRAFWGRVGSVTSHPMLDDHYIIVFHLSSVICFFIVSIMNAFRSSGATLSSMLTSRNTCCLCVNPPRLGRQQKSHQNVVYSTSTDTSIMIDDLIGQPKIVVPDRSIIFKGWFGHARDNYNNQNQIATTFTIAQLFGNVCTPACELYKCVDFFFLTIASNPTTILVVNCVIDDV